MLQTKVSLLKSKEPSDQDQQEVNEDTKENVDLIDLSSSENNGGKTAEQPSKVVVLEGRIIWSTWHSALKKGILEDSFVYGLNTLDWCLIRVSVLLWFEICICAILNRVLRGPRLNAQKVCNFYFLDIFWYLRSKTAKVLFQHTKCNLIWE